MNGKQNSWPNSISPTSLPFTDLKRQMTFFFWSWNGSKAKPWLSVLPKDHYPSKRLWRSAVRLLKA